MIKRDSYNEPYAFAYDLDGKLVDVLLLPRGQGKRVMHQIGDEKVETVGFVFRYSDGSVVPDTAWTLDQFEAACMGAHSAREAARKRQKPKSWLGQIETTAQADKELATLDRMEPRFIERVETAPPHLKRGRERDLADLRSDRKRLERKRETMSR